ncbi:MAG: J domain-containing protein [Firmicutes bacterium]|nr:J domain-containing protein [Bacillota bacterium]
MLKFTNDELQRACRILNLPEKATISSIKEHYRNLCHQWHPDHCQNAPESDTKMKEVNWAYRLLMEYCMNYVLHFTGEIIENNPDPSDWWMKQFGNDPIWGPGDK